MKVFLQSINIEFWFIVIDSSYEVTTIDDATNLNRLKTRQKLDEKNKIYLSLNVKAMNVLYNTLETNKSCRIKGRKSTKKI